MKVILHLNEVEANELVKATNGMAIGLQVKMATLKAQTKDLKKAIVFAQTNGIESEVNAVEAALVKGK